MGENEDLLSGDEEEDGNRDKFESIENIDEFEDDSSNAESTSEASSLADTDSEDNPIDARLWRPTEYFQELNSLESKVLHNSMVRFYTVIPDHNLSIQMLNTGRREASTSSLMVTFD